MERALQVLNDLAKEGVIARYAIAGGVGAMFYMEPFLTHDLDVFVELPVTPGGLVTLAPLYEALKRQGYQPEGECLNIEGIPVQFLPAYNALAEEALAEAREAQYGATAVRVLRPEHLAALMLQTGRGKDRQRLASFAREAEMDAAYLQDVLVRYGLTARWTQWTR